MKNYTGVFHEKFWVMMQINRWIRVLNWIIKWTLYADSWKWSVLLYQHHLKQKIKKLHKWFYEIMAQKLCCSVAEWGHWIHCNFCTSQLCFFCVKLNMASTRRSTTALPRVWLIDGLLVFVCLSLQVPQVTDGETTVPWLSSWQEWPLASIISTGYVCNSHQ